MNINYFPYVHSHLDNLFTLMFMLQFLKYAEDMNSQVFAELPTTVVSDTSLLEETLPVELHLGANISEICPDFISLTAKIFDNKGQSLLKKKNNKKRNLYSAYDAKISKNFFIALG